VRVWDVSAGYLNRQSLLGEHRELHGLYTILTQGKTGYSRHPETLRWVGALDGVCWRHAQQVAEMTLRGYMDRSPLPPGCAGGTWPAAFVDEPAVQFKLLRAKYAGLDKGRIPLPRNAQQLWAQHKYSVMARDPREYRRLGRAVARLAPRDSLDDLARTLVLILREPPPIGRLVNTLQHMWGHVSDRATLDDKVAAERGPAALLSRIQALAIARREKYLLASTALGELAVYA
jgi:hypothetical protein